MPVRKKAPEDLTAKKTLALEVIRRLKAEYPDAGCTLDYDHAWQLLVSVRLAAQCTDAPNTSPMMRFALLRPTPGKASNSSKVLGTRQLY